MDKIEQAGGVVFKLDEGQPKILLVRARNARYWIFPKGHLEQGESPEQAAIREVREEAGVQSKLVCLLDPKLRFKAGGENVEVQYSLLVCESEGPSPEGRERAWFAAHEALTELSFDDARALLRRTLPDIARRALDATPIRPDAGAYHSLLIAEYQHLAESFLRNEEAGEKRIAFLITLAGVTAAGAGVVLEDAAPTPDERHPLLLVALGILAILGYLTLVRVLNRNAASDEYKIGLSIIRRYFLASRDDPRASYFLFDPFDYSPRKAPSPWSSGGGGWLVTAIAFECALLGGLAGVLFGSDSWSANLLFGSGFAAVAWFLLHWIAAEKYEARMRPWNPS